MIEWLAVFGAGFGTASAFTILFAVAPALKRLTRRLDELEAWTRNNMEREP